MNFGRSLALEHHGHPSTPGLIAVLFNNGTETVKAGAQYKYINPKWTNARTLCRLSLADFCLSVEDHVRLHVATLLHPDVSNERIFAYGQPYTVAWYAGSFAKTLSREDTRSRYARRSTGRQ